MITCGGNWKPTRSCNAHDLFIVREGLQCGNCGKVTYHVKIPTVVRYESIHPEVSLQTSGDRLGC